MNRGGGGARSAAYDIMSAINRGKPGYFDADDLAVCQSVFEMIANETSLDRTSEDGQRLAAITLRLYEQGVKDPHSLKIMVETARGIFTSVVGQQQAL